MLLYSSCSSLFWLHHHHRSWHQGFCLCLLFSLAYMFWSFRVSKVFFCGHVCTLHWSVLIELLLLFCLQLWTFFAIVLFPIHQEDQGLINTLQSSFNSYWQSMKFIEEKNNNHFRCRALTESWFMTWEFLWRSWIYPRFYIYILPNPFLSYINITSRITKKKICRWDLNILCHLYNRFHPA